ncbi:MAG: hypothetical protein KA133_05875 [Flavobacterium sp.]|nr:hypothetical protein [Flavobacterium sp.]
MKSEIKYWITLVGIIAGGIAYWLQPYGQSKIFGIGIWTVMGIDAFMGSFFLMISLAYKPYLIALFVSLGVAIAILARIFYDITFWDKTSHNLAPFEFIIGGFVTIPSAYSGAYLALLIKKMLPKKQNL